MNKKLNCPSCRKEYEVDSERQERAECSRCQCELEPLILIRKAASDQLCLSWTSLAAAEYHPAMKYAEQSWSLLHTLESAECGLIASVLIKDSKKVRLWIQRMRE